MMHVIDESVAARVVQLRGELGSAYRPGELPISESAKEFRELWNMTAFAWLAMRLVWPSKDRERTPASASPAHRRAQRAGRLSRSWQGPFARSWRSGSH